MLRTGNGEEKLRPEIDRVQAPAGRRSARRGMAGGDDRETGCREQSVLTLAHGRRLRSDQGRQLRAAERAASNNHPLRRDQELPCPEHCRRLANTDADAVELWGAPGGVAGCVEVTAGAATAGDGADPVHRVARARGVDGGLEIGLAGLEQRSRGEGDPTCEERQGSPNATLCKERWANILPISRLVTQPWPPSSMQLVARIRSTHSDHGTCTN